MRCLSILYFPKSRVVSAIHLRVIQLNVIAPLHLAQEYQSCNLLPCPDLKKTTPWTPWSPVNISDSGGHYEQRFRHTCRARVPDPGLLEVGRQRVEMRYCSKDGSTGCSTEGGTFDLLWSSPDTITLQVKLQEVSTAHFLLGYCVKTA